MGADNTIVSSIKSLNSKTSYAKINLVKSKYILKQVFDHIIIRKKLKIIIHNKELRSILEYNINDYKKLSEKEIIIEKNGKGKEYIIDKNILIFEGEYSKGKRNGKGNEYYINGQLKSEGTYLKGEKNGKFKEYYFNGQLKFDGEYLNGNKIKGIGFDIDDTIIYETKKNGIIQEYYNNGILKFKGKYIKKNILRGKEYYDNGKLKFEGEYLNGKKWNGKIYNKYFDHIELEIKSGKGRGRGREFLNDYIFNGKYINGQKNGWGYEYYYNNYEYSFSKEILKFVGDYYNDEKINGKEYNIYGNLILSIENRKIKEYYRNREIKFEGEYLNGKRWNGKIYNYNNDEIYELKYGNGEVKEYNEYEDILFEGKYINGQKNGEGKLYHHSKLIFQGEYLNGKKNGKGKEYNNNGKLIFDGIYYNDNGMENAFAIMKMMTKIIKIFLN